MIQHDSGRFAGKQTGLIEEVTPVEDPMTALLKETPELAAFDPTLRGICVFREVGEETCEEHEFVATLTPRWSEASVVELLRKKGADAAWYALDAVPYADMPADDLLWYPFILGGDEATAIRGEFTFYNESLVSNAVWEVDNVTNPVIWSRRYPSPPSHIVDPQGRGSRSI